MRGIPLAFTISILISSFPPKAFSSPNACFTILYDNRKNPSFENAGVAFVKEANERIVFFEKINKQ